jgi:hypothetical protein
MLIRAPYNQATTGAPNFLAVSSSCTENGAPENCLLSRRDTQGSTFHTTRCAEALKAVVLFVLL